MKKFYYCGGCAARFEAEETLFEGTSAVCPACGTTRPIGEFAEINFCPHCQNEIAIPLDVRPGTTLKCAECGSKFRVSAQRFLDEDTASASGETVLAPPESSFAPGDFFDKFEIIRQLGRGGMGEVYLARHLLLNQQVALKILSADSAGDAHAAARFVQEARIADRIDHPNMVRVFDAGADLKTGRLFISMEYVDGWTLSQILKTQKFSEADAVMIGTEVCKVLEVLEEHGIVHRDIKPSNIMLDRQGHVKLADLGIAKSESRANGDLTLTRDGIVFGTPEYASPEQCRSAHSADHRSDIYSLGATLFHLVGGEPPYSGKTPLDVAVKVLKEPPRSLYKLNPELSSGFLLLIRDMMRRDPARRPAHASEVRVRLESLAAGRSGNLLDMLPKNLVQSSWFDRLRSTATPKAIEVGETEARSDISDEEAAKARSRRWTAILTIAALISAAATIVQLLPQAARSARKPARAARQNTAAQEAADLQELPSWLAERWKRCREQQDLAKTLPNDTPERRQYRNARRKFLYAQETLLKKQIGNFRKAQEAARQQYRRENARQVEALLRDARTVARNSKAVLPPQAYERLKALLKDPGTDPNLHIRETPQSSPQALLSCSYQGIIPSFAEELEHHSLQSPRAELQQILFSRYASVPEDFRSSDLPAIRYGISEKNLLPIRICRSEWIRTVMLSGMPDRNDRLPDLARFKVHKPVVRLTGLHWAVVRSDPELFRFALAAVSSPSAVDSDGQTALHWAVKYDRRQFVEPLLAAGCDPAVRDRKGRLYTDPEIRSEIYRLESVQDPARRQRILKDAKDVDILLPSGLTPLQYCVSVLQDFELADRLLDQNADPRLIGVPGSVVASALSPILGDVLEIAPPDPLPDGASRQKADMQARILARILQAYPELLIDADPDQLNRAMCRKPVPNQPDYHSAVRKAQTVIRSAYRRLPKKAQNALREKMPPGFSLLMSFSPPEDKPGSSETKAPVPDRTDSALQTAQNVVQAAIDLQPEKAQEAIRQSGTAPAASDPAPEVKPEPAAETKAEAAAVPQDIPPWLADRVRRNLKQKDLAAALPEDTAAKRQYKNARLKFLNEQEKLLEQQIASARMAKLVAQKKYDKTNAAMVKELLVPSKKTPAGQFEPLKRLLKDPDTDPNLCIRTSPKSQPRSLLHLCSTYGWESPGQRDFSQIQAQRQELLKILFSRYVTIPEDFFSADPQAIRYGIPEKQLSSSAWTVESLRTLMQYGMIGDDDRLPESLRFRAHKSVTRMSGLHWAVLSADSAFFHFALSAVSSPSAVDSDGQTALHWAIKYDRRQFVEPLLAAGCDPAVRDRKGRLYTDLETRSEICRIESVQDPERRRQILNDAENVDILLPSGLTPLQYCVFVLRDFDLANRLLDKGADPGAVGVRITLPRGATPTSASIPIIWRLIFVSQPMVVSKYADTFLQRAESQARFLARILQNRPELLEDASPLQLGITMRQKLDTCQPAYRSAVRTAQNAIRSALDRLPAEVQKSIRRRMELVSTIRGDSGNQSSRRTRRTQKK